MPSTPVGLTKSSEKTLKMGAARLPERDVELYGVPMLSLDDGLWVLPIWRQRNTGKIGANWLVAGVPLFRLQVALSMVCSTSCHRGMSAMSMSGHGFASRIYLVWEAGWAMTSLAPRA